MAKIIGNTTATPNPRPDWAQVDETKADYIKNKPTLEGLATETYVDDSISENNNKVAPAIQNTISGGKKVLTINDVSPLAHKCSCRLTSDVVESRNIYKFDSSNMFLDDTYYPITYTINDDGTITVNGHTQDYYTELSILLKGLTIGATYTISFRFPDGKLQLPQIVFFKDVNGEEIGNSMEFMGEYYTFRHDNEAIDCYEVHFPVYATPEEPFVNATLYPQLELGEVATEWQEYGGSPYITDFTTVKVNAGGKSYTPNADGTVTDIASVSPTMEITTDNEHVNICDFTYCVDTKKYVDSNATSADFIIVTNELPETGESNKLYLVPKADSQEQDLFDEFIWVNNTWEWITTKQIEVDLTDYVKNTDYATKDKAGVIKINSIHGVSIYNGELMIERANASEIAAKKLDRNPITPAYLDIAVKTGVTTNTIPLTEEEKASACEWLGVDGLVGDIDEALDEIIEIQESLKDGYTGGTGGVSSWNDLTDKPFYDEEVWNELLPNSVCTFTRNADMGNACIYITTLTTEMLEKFKGDWNKAFVVWDEVEYECNPKLAFGATKGIGNVGFFDGTEDSGEPFLIMVDDGINTGGSPVAIIISVEDSKNAIETATHSVGISLMVETIHPIDTKFIDNISWNKISDKPFYDEGTKTATLDYANPPTVGIDFNGVFLGKVTDDILTADYINGAKLSLSFTVDDTVTNVSQELNTDTLMGFSFPFGSAYQFTDENITCMIAVATQSGEFDPFGDGNLINIPETGTYIDCSFISGEGTINSISLEYAGELKTLDIKFIPDSLYTAIDQRIENYINEALGGDY